MRRSIWIGGLLLAAAALPALADIGAGYMLFGSASFVSPGNHSNRAVKLVSNATANPAVFSGINFGVPEDLTINGLNELSTDYNFTAATCDLGSPRFVVQLANFPGKSIFVYIGPPPSYTGCVMNTWTNTGNLLMPGSLVDDSQLGGGQSDTWASVQTKFNGQPISQIFLVSDNGPGGSQTVLIDNTDVAGQLHTYEFTSANSCKDGGWRRFTFPPGPFKNQGQCVSHFEHQKHQDELQQ